MSGGPLLRVLVALPLALALPVPAVAQTSARDTLPIVTGIEVEGNRAFGDDEILRSIATASTSCKSVFLAPLCLVGLESFKRVSRLDRRELRTDVARIKVFYRRRGFRRAEVDTVLVGQDDRVKVTFIVDEGEPILVRSVELTGLDGIEDAGAIGEDLPLSPGRPFSEIDLARSRNRIERELANRGYAEAAVLVEARVPASDTMGAHVTLNAEPGPRYTIGSISVRGTVELEPEDVIRLLSFDRGEVYRLDEIVRSQRNLYSMALFDYVDVRARPAEGDSVVVVEVQVGEARLRGIQFGAGVSTTECITVQSGWANHNFLGGTRTLEFNAQLSNIATRSLAEQFPCSQAGVSTDDDLGGADVFNRINWVVRADFRQPWFLGTKNWLQLGLFSERQSLPRVYARTGLGGEVRLTREISLGTAATLSYRPAQDRVDEGSADFLFCANFLICNPADIAVLEEPRLLSPLTLSVARSRTDGVLSPRSGYRLTLEAETASRFTGSDWAYYRAQGEIAYYQPVGSGSVLALRLRGGALRAVASGIEGVEFAADREAVTNPLKRQYAGGAFTVRGFGENLLGPKVLLAPLSNLDCGVGGDTLVVTPQNTLVCNPNDAGLTSDAAIARAIGGLNSLVANAEIRVPLGSDRWRGVVFVDVGRVWSSGGDVPEAERLAWSPGFGIRYLSPVGPLRLDIGYNTSSGPQRLPVVTQLEENTPFVCPECDATNLPSAGTIVQLGNSANQAEKFRYDPFEGKSFVRRLVLHFSIGQAF